eukprot:RCo000746
MEWAYAEGGEVWLSPRRRVRSASLSERGVSPACASLNSRVARILDSAAKADPPPEWSAFLSPEGETQESRRFSAGHALPQLERPDEYSFSMSLFANLMSSPSSPSSPHRRLLPRSAAPPTPTHRPEEP